MNLTKKEYKSYYECLNIECIRLGKLNPNWLLQINSNYSPSIKDKEARINSKQREKNQLTIKIY
jgi:hypothetical protein